MGVTVCHLSCLFSTHLHDKLWTLCSNLDVCFWDSPAHKQSETDFRNRPLAHAHSVQHDILFVPLHNVDKVLFYSFTHANPNPTQHTPVTFSRKLKLWELSVSCWSWYSVLVVLSFYGWSHRSAASHVALTPAAAQAERKQVKTYSEKNKALPNSTNGLCDHRM